MRRDEPTLQVRERHLDVPRHVRRVLLGEGNVEGRVEDVPPGEAARLELEVLELERAEGGHAAAVAPSNKQDEPRLDGG